MKSVPLGPVPEEIELKLALPAYDPSTLARQLARIPVLARRKHIQLLLHNIYFDTPEQFLRQQRIALRLRRVSQTARPQWLQTLKTTDRNDSALSQRGEWEVPVRGPRLSLQALQGTPWTSIDAQGAIFPALAPVFETTFERTLWLVRRRDGSVLEVALDIGQIVAGTKRAPICELELELKVGRTVALFEFARQIADSIAVLPASPSKAERGYALAQNSFDVARRAHSPPLAAKQPLPETAQIALREMFSQFTTNLGALPVSDDPEVVHQARIGWRRFRSAKRFFKPLLRAEAVPSWQPLQALLGCLGKLRDLNVARIDTLPPIATAYAAENPQRIDLWHSMTLTLDQATDLQRKAIRHALQEPAVGTCLLATTQWLESFTDPGAAINAVREIDAPTRGWTRARIDRLHEQLKLALTNIDQPDHEHRIRILAKRMRYNVEALQYLLPVKVATRWQQQAGGLQTILGARRDARSAADLVAELEVDHGLAEFLRGFALAQDRWR